MRSEIQFRQVAGDFQRFQGKWMLQEVRPNGEVREGGVAVCGVGSMSPAHCSKETRVLCACMVQQRTSHIPRPPCLLVQDSPQTSLKYAVEVVMPSSGRLLGVIEPLMERIVFEDMPANLVAIKRRAEVCTRGGGGGCHPCCILASQTH